jgi:hypothetical protein
MAIKLVSALSTPQYIQFQNSSGTNTGKIETSGDDLIITNAVGNVLFGDLDSDVYIGDGVNSVDILFEQSGAIRGEGSVTLTLGSSNTTLNVYNPQMANGMTLTSTMTMGTGAVIDFLPNTGAIINLDGQTILKRNTFNGGITLGHDDAVIIAGGDTYNTLESNISLGDETVFLGAEGGVTIYAFPNNDTAWSNRKEFIFSNDTNFYLDGRVYPSNQATNYVDSTSISNWNQAYGWGDHSDGGYLASSSYTASDVLTKIKTVDGSGSGLDADTVDGIQASSFLRSNAADTATGEILFDAGFKSDPIMLSGSQNFDNISRSGFYNLYNANSGSTNSPGFDYGTMIVIGNNKQSSGFGFQLAHERLNSAGKFKVRGMNDTASAWSSWATVWTSLDFANNSSNWNTAYGWGNHGSAGYLTTATAATTYAPLASPALTGTPTAPTAGASTNTTQLATTAFVQTAVSNLVDSAPGALNTLNELAAALGDDANFSTTITNSIATKLPLAGGTMTGRLIIDVDASGDGSWDDSGILLRNDGSPTGEIAIAFDNASTGSNYWIYGLNQGDVLVWGYGTSFVGGNDKMTLNTSGNLAITGTYGFKGGSNTITDTKVGNWDTAYGWGNHASAGYLTAHPSITQAANVNNSGGTVIQDLTFDSNGHVTATNSVNLDNIYTSTDGTESDYRWSINLGSGTGTRWYKVGTVNVGSGGMTLRGLLSNHVESFATQQFDIAIQGRENNVNGAIEITGNVNVLHGGVGVLVVSGDQPGSYLNWDVYIVTTNYSMAEIDLTKTSSSFHTSYSYETSKPSGTVELDTTTLAEGNYVIDDSVAKEIYHEGHKPTYAELGTMAYTNLTGTPTIPSGNAVIDWTTDQGSTNIHSGNYTNTTYSNATTSASGLMSSTDKTKLDGIAASANNYSLPAGSSTTRGGFKIGYSENGKNYPVEVTSEKMYVNVPWTDNNTDTITSVGVTGSETTGTITLTGAGATTITQSGGGIEIRSTDTNTTYTVGDGGLTQKNFTTTLKNKLDGIEASADVTDATNVSAAGALMRSGGTISGDLTVNGEFKITDAVDVSQWGRSYSVSNTVIEELLLNDGSSFENGGAYRVVGHIDGTGTDQSSVAVFWNQNGTWYVNVAGQSGTSSNHIQFLVSSGVPSVKTYHSNNYTVRVYHERIGLSEGTGTDNARYYFGADSYLSDIAGTLKFHGTHNIWHAGNSEAFTSADHTKLDGIAASANNYSLPVAGSSIGGVKSGTDITVDGSGNVSVNNDSHTHDGRYYTETEINTGNITTSGTWTFNGVVNGLYHSVEEDHYYFDDYNGRRNVNAFLKTQFSDIVKYRAVDNVEYWNGSSWVDGSSQINNVKNLLDGRKDTNWYVPSTYYKFRFTVTAATSWPTMALIGIESSWTGSSYPGCQLLVEEQQADNSWVTKVTADFTSANGVSNWGTMFKADTALHTGRGAQTYSTRITIDFDGWSPSNSSYVTIPLQNIFIYSNFSGIANNDYHNLLNYDRHVTVPTKLFITTTDTNTSSTTALVLNGTEVEKRTLGSNAFNSTAYSTASGVEDNADVTDTANVVAALTAGTNIQIAANGTISATDTDTVYVHPTSAGNKHIPTGGAAGQFLKYSSSGTAVWATPSYTTNTDTVTRVGISGSEVDGVVTIAAGGDASISQSGNTITITANDTNTTYTVGDGGLTQKNFTTTLKTKLDGIAAGANNYVHPTTAGNKHIPSGGSAGQFLKYSSSGTAVWAADNNTTYTVGDGGLTQKNFTTTLKTKLDGIASGADAYTGWNFVDTSDTVTRIDSLEYFKITGSDISGTGTSSDPYVVNTPNTDTTYTADGNYGMTLSGTAFRLENDRRRNSTTQDIYTGNTHDYTFYDADIGIRWYTAGAEEMRLEDDGDLHVDGDVIAFSTTVSDARLKDDVETIENATEKVKQLRGVEYTWNKGSRKGQREIGVIAQEVEAVVPEVVHDKKLPLVDNETYKTVDYEKLVALLIESNKELAARVETLEAKLDGITK